MKRWLIVAVAMLLTQYLAACAGRQGATADKRNFHPSQLVKADVDNIVEAHEQALYFSLKVLAEKLYKRNPKEWKKGGWAHAEAPLTRLFGKQHNWRFDELDGKSGVDALQMALDPGYPGDRVFALTAGMGGMVLAAFDNRYEFYLTDSLDAQKLYNAARNVEIAVWKLSNARDAEGNLLLLSNETGTPSGQASTQVANLSFEREFGKMIGNLDLLSNTIADKEKRVVVKVVQSMATAVFLPIAGVP